MTGKIIKYEQKNKIIESTVQPNPKEAEVWSIPKADGSRELKYYDESSKEWKSAGGGSDASAPNMVYFDGAVFDDIPDYCHNYLLFVATIICGVTDGMAHFLDLEHYFTRNYIDSNYYKYTPRAFGVNLSGLHFVDESKDVTMLTGEQALAKAVSKCDLTMEEFIAKYSMTESDFFSIYN